MTSKLLSNISEISFLLDLIDNTTDWSIGSDGEGGHCPPSVFAVLEYMYSTILPSRPNYSSIKYISKITDDKAYEWHDDRENPTELDITHTILVYLRGCEGSILELIVNDQILKLQPVPYDLITINAGMLHRATGNWHGKLLKFTFRI